MPHPLLAFIVDIMIPRLVIYSIGGQACLASVLSQLYHYTAIETGEVGPEDLKQSLMKLAYCKTQVGKEEGSPLDLCRPTETSQATDAGAQML